MVKPWTLGWSEIPNWRYLLLSLHQVGYETEGPSPSCRAEWRNTSSVGDMLDELEWPSLEARREQSSLTFFYKIHSGTVSLDKDKNLTPAPNLQRTRASHDLQYTRYFAYSDALKNSFFPRTIPMWNSLPSSVVSSKTIEEFKGLI